MRDVLVAVGVGKTFGVGAGALRAVDDVSLTMAEGELVSIIGPSGCGKSTLIRCLNRIHEVVPGARAEGRVLLGTEDVYAKGVDPVAVRRRIGMVFQKPNPFPMMSVYENVASGLRLRALRPAPKSAPWRWESRATWRPARCSLGYSGSPFYIPAP